MESEHLLTRRFGWPVSWSCWRDVLRFSRCVIAGVMLAPCHEQMRGRGQVAQIGKQPSNCLYGVGREFPCADFGRRIHQQLPDG